MAFPNTKGCKPDPDSAFRRVLAWFLDPLNRHEMLSAADIAAREDLTPAQARRILYRLTAEKLVRGEYVYRPNTAKESF